MSKVETELHTFTSKYPILYKVFLKVTKKMASEKDRLLGVYNAKAKTNRSNTGSCFLVKKTLISF